MAKKFGNFSASKEEVSLEIDLDKIDRRLKRNPDVMNAIGQAIIDKMVEKSNNLVDWQGKRFISPYSDSYEKSAAFKAAGKSKNQVNLELSGEMLDSIDILELNSSKIKIGINNETAPRAMGHTTGFAGHPTIPNGKYKRDFMGISKKEVEEIAGQFSEALDELEQERSQRLRDLADTITGENVLDVLFGDVDDGL